MNKTTQNKLEPTEDFFFHNDMGGWMIRGPAGFENTAVEVKKRNGEVKKMQLGDKLYDEDEKHTIYNIGVLPVTDGLERLKRKMGDLN